MAFEIVAKRRENPLALADIEDFSLRRSGVVPVEHVLTNPCVSLYTIDFKGGRAVFVETPPAIDLSSAPFYYSAQYANAVRVLTVPLRTFVPLAQSIRLDDHRLILIYSTGRAGSTLASKIFAQVEGVMSLSEPDSLSAIAALRSIENLDPRGFSALLDATLRMLCKATPRAYTNVIKTRSFVIELADLLARLFPQSRRLFLYRDAARWLDSAIRAFGDFSDARDGAGDLSELSMRAHLAPVTPLLREHPQERHLPVSGVLALVWLSVMDRYLKLIEWDIEMLAIHYESWTSAPLETACAMLSYCGCRTTEENLRDVALTLSRDSQEDSVLSREAVARRTVPASAGDRDELLRHLLRHPVIRTIDYVAPRTLHVSRIRALSKRPRIKVPLLDRA